MIKEPKGVFYEADKEPVIERVFRLIERYPSRSAAARAWGININTLKNYYRRQDIQPTPRPSQLKKIADVENVSLEWLTTGQGEGPKNQERTGSVGQNDRLTDMLSYLTEVERVSLTEVIARKGLETILYLLDEDNIKILQLPSALKQQIIIAHQANTEEMVNQGKVCAGPEAEDSTQLGLTRKHKKAV